MEKWATTAKMKINKKKSGVMYIRKNERSEEGVRKFEEKGEQLLGYPIVREYKYLGVVFDEALKF